MKILTSKNLRRITAYALPAAILAIPVFAFAADSQLVDGGREAEFYTWKEFISVLQRVASFMIKLAVALAAGMFMWAGWKYVTAGGDEGKVKEAHKIFKQVAVGVGLVVAAFLIVEVLIKSVGGENSVSDWIRVK